MAATLEKEGLGARSGTNPFCGLASCQKNWKVRTSTVSRNGVTDTRGAVIRAGEQANPVPSAAAHPSDTKKRRAVRAPRRTTGMTLTPSIAGTRHRSPRLTGAADLILRQSGGKMAASPTRWCAPRRPTG
jgi:hypothetical protein